MKNTGIIRGIDSLGRIVLPKELRTSLGLEPDTQVEIFVEGDTVLLRKYQPQNTCVLCGKAAPDMAVLNGRCVCGACRAALRQL